MLYVNFDMCSFFFCFFSFQSVWCTVFETSLEILILSLRREMDDPDVVSRFDTLWIGVRCVVEILLYEPTD